MYARLRPFTFERPSSVEEALRIFAEADDPVYLAGGTALVPAWRIGSRRQPRTVISLARLTSGSVAADDSGFRLGAAATVASLMRTVGPRRDALGDALAAFATPQVRERATVAGNIAWAAPDSALIPALMVLDAAVAFRSIAGPAQGALAGMVRPEGATLPAGGLITEVAVPAALPSSASAYGRLSSAGEAGPLVVSAAVSLHFDPVGDPRHALVAVAGAATAPACTGVLADGPGLREFCERVLETALAEAVLVTDPTASSEYRAQMLRVVVRRVLNVAVRRHLGGGHDHGSHRPETGSERAVRATADPAERDASGGAPRSPEPDGGEGVVRGGTLRIVHGARGRSAGELVHRPRG